MIQNLLLVAMRSLKKRTFYSLLNLAGLTVSMSFAFLLWVYVKDQKSYDQGYRNADRIYRVDADLNMNGKRDLYSNGPRPVAPLFKSDFPEVEDAVRLRGIGGLEIHTSTLQVDEKKVKSREVFAADSTVFTIFERAFVQGSPDHALAAPNSIVISESLAQRIFDTTDALGKQVMMAEAGILLTVTGVMKDQTDRTHFPMEALISWSTFPRERDMTQWYGAHVYTYILLREGADIRELEAKVPAFYEKYMKAEFDRFNGHANLVFQPLLSIYLSAPLVWEAYPHGSATNVKALSVVILFLLIFAAINYVNLATARAAERAAEVGIRKTLGSSTRMLVVQFLTESILLSSAAGVLSLGLSWVLSPYFNLISDMEAPMAQLLSLANIFEVMLVAIAMGLAAGMYPAFYLSSLQSLEVLKGKFASGGKGEWLRKILVTGQYFIAATLIASILFVAEQTRYIKNKDIGFNKENLLTVTVPQDSTVIANMHAFAEQLKSDTHIAGATLTYFPLDKEANHFNPTLENEDGTSFQMGADFMAVDFDFIPTIGAQLVAGRNFQPDNKADESSMIINEAAVKQFGWEKNPLGGKMASWTPNEPNAQKVNVIGVVKDFNLGVSYHSVSPLLIFPAPEGGSDLYVRIKANETLEAVAAVKKTWTNMFPAQPFEFAFLDQSLNALYNREEKFLNLLTSFSFIILVIASIGIIGLISFTTVLKKKEIAIRKVLGSPMNSVIRLLSARFVILLLIANGIALPTTYYLMGQWLDNFAYRIELGPIPFVIAAGVCVLFTALSLAYHTMHAALENPVNALRSE